MVSADKIIQAAIEHEAQIIGLSGLITPSLEEMAHVAGEMRCLFVQAKKQLGGAR